jgi:hypothetical protein
MQLVSTTQLVGQPAAVPVQTYGEHDGEPAPPGFASTQVPVAQLPQGPQVLLQQTVLTQLPELH